MAIKFFDEIFEEIKSGKHTIKDRTGIATGKEFDDWLDNYKENYMKEIDMSSQEKQLMDYLLAYGGKVKVVDQINNITDEQKTIMIEDITEKFVKIIIEKCI